MIDVRPGLRMLGHPAGKRTDTVWGANHVRAIIDWAWAVLSGGSRSVGQSVTPAEVARWLWEDEQFDELRAMAAAIEDKLAEGEEKEAWRKCWQALSPDATWEDTPERENKG